MAAHSRRTVVARSHVVLHRIFDRVDVWAGRATSGLGRYEAEAVGLRLAQASLFRFLPGYLSQAAKSDKFLDEAESRVLRAGGVIVDSSTGAIRAEPRVVAACLARFTLHWAYALATYAGNIFRFGECGVSATLVYGVPTGAIAPDGSDEIFAAFCRQGPIEPLAQSKSLLVETSLRLNSSRPAEIRYHPRPLAALTGSIGVRAVLGLPRFLAEHLRAGAAFLAAVAQEGALCLLWRDFAYHACAWTLNRRGMIEAVIITNSDFHQQFLWMTDLPERRFKTHMLWYSTNITLHKYKEEPVEAADAQFRYVRCDLNWAWSAEHARIIARARIHSPARIVGPLLWRLPKPRVRSSRPFRTVAIFDITPFDADWLLENGFPEVYVGRKTMTAFLQDIVEECARLENELGVPIRVVLKHKREFSANHDQDYIAFSRELVKSKKNVVALAPDSDVFEMLSQADIAIAAPYSSPVDTALSMGIPSIYYDPAAVLLPDADCVKGARFASGRAELRKALKELLFDFTTTA